LLAAPGKTLRTVMDFIDEPWDSAVLNYSEYGPKGHMAPFPWLSDATKRIHKTSSNWRQSLSPVWIHYIQQKFKNTFDRYGYKPIKIEPAPTYFETLRAILSELPEAFSYGWRLVRLIRNISGRYPADPKKVEALLFTLNIRALKNFPALYSEIVGKAREWGRTRFP
jgi:hypothetical protein